MVLKKSTSKNISTPLTDVGSRPTPSCTSALVINSVSKVVVSLPEWVKGGNSKKIEEEGAELNAKV
jgi:pyrimidine deaminase RibD-like protein